VPKFWVGARPIVASVLALVVVGACVTVSGPATSSPGLPTVPAAVSLPPIPTIAIPTLPPIPSITIPSFEVPSFELPSFELPSFELPSFAIPSFEVPSFAVPSIGAGNGECSILSTAAANAATGTTWTLADASITNQCTFIDSTFAGKVTGFNLRRGTGESIATGKLVERAGQDMTVAGHTAFWGPGLHQLYVDLGGDTLVILLVSSDDAASLDLAQKLATAILAQ
jgi:hypothetical protein